MAEGRAVVSNTLLDGAVLHHDLVSKCRKLRYRQWLGEHIGDVLFTWDVMQLDGSLFLFVLKMMIFDVYVL